MSTMETEAQERYLLHQRQGKKAELVALMEERHSHRRFSTDIVNSFQIEELIQSTALCPSSCDRHGVRIKVVTERDDKDLLGGLLVGGVGWCHRSPVILLLFANPAVYKADSGNEVNYNSYLDAGIMVQQMNLFCTAAGLHSAFVNPNIRIENKAFFMGRFKPDSWESALFCGALCVGWPHPNPIDKKRNLVSSMEC